MGQQQLHCTRILKDHTKTRKPPAVKKASLLSQLYVRQTVVDGAQRLTKCGACLPNTKLWHPASKSPLWWADYFNPWASYSTEKMPDQFCDEHRYIADETAGSCWQLRQHVAMLVTIDLLVHHFHHILSPHNGTPSPNILFFFSHKHSLGLQQFSSHLAYNT